jgi:hypothetical protein
MYRKIAHCNLITLPLFIDGRGDLTAFNLDNYKRSFWLTGAPNDCTRGNHAHRQCDHLMICLTGSVTVTVNDGLNKKDFFLDSPNVALFVPSMIWDSETFYNKAVLLVFASETYSDRDYIRDFDEYKRLNGVE